MYEINDFSLFTDQGERKYLNRAERKRFYECTLEQPLEKRMYILIYHYTGGRLNEVAVMGKNQVDYKDRTVILRTLKQRRENVFRQIPLPDYILNGLKELSEQSSTLDMWSFSSRSGARYIKSVMYEADINGIIANARGIRHGFAVHAASKAPLTQVSKWMGHAHLRTTAIYLNVTGQEEREWAEKLWDN